MRAGILNPWWVRGYGYDSVVRVSRVAEELGFDSVWFADHLAVPSARLPHLHRPWFEVISLMAHVAGLTSRIALGTNVLVAPYRPPVPAAKMLATLDVVSKGRPILGVGTGFLEEELVALGVSHFKDRGSYTDSCIRTWKAVWSGEVDRTLTGPDPTQRPHPPLWLDNRGPRVLRRVVELGDGWHPVGLNLNELREGRKRLLELWTDAFKWIRGLRDGGRRDGDCAPAPAARIIQDPNATAAAAEHGIEIQVRDVLSPPSPS